MSAGVSRGLGRPSLRAAGARKRSARGGMSSVRRRSGGSSTGMTLSRPRPRTISPDSWTPPAGGHDTALSALRAFLDDSPEAWRHAGDPAAHAERAWAELAAEPDLLAGEALARQLAALKAELAGPAPTPLERLLVERIAATWLQVHYADAMAARARNVSIKQAGLAIERQDRAHRRHLAAVAALETVRRLLPAAPEVPAKPAPRGTRP